MNAKGSELGIDPFERTLAPHADEQAEVEGEDLVSVQAADSRS